MAVLQQTRSSQLLYLFLFVSRLPSFLRVLSVAPDDFENECAMWAEPGKFNNSNEKVLMDTQFYGSGNLLTV